MLISQGSERNSGFFITDRSFSVVNGTTSYTAAAVTERVPLVAMVTQGFHSTDTSFRRCLEVAVCTHIDVLVVFAQFVATGVGFLPVTVVGFDGVLTTVLTFRNETLVARITTHGCFVTVP